MEASVSLISHGGLLPLTVVFLTDEASLRLTCDGLLTKVLSTWFPTALTTIQTQPHTHTHTGALVPSLQPLYIL